MFHNPPWTQMLSLQSNKRTALMHMMCKCVWISAHAFALFTVCIQVGLSLYVCMTCACVRAQTPKDIYVCGCTLNAHIHGHERPCMDELFYASLFDGVWSVWHAPAATACHNGTTCPRRCTGRWRSAPR